MPTPFPKAIWHSVVNHCCLKTAGQIIQWQGDSINVWPSTQNVPGITHRTCAAVEGAATNIKVKMDYIGGGFAAS